MSEKEYSVYMHINKVNDKKYIGITSQPVSRRWRKNGEGYKQCVLFYRAIKKYGWDNFEHIVLKEKLTEQEAKQMEKNLIKKYNSNNKKYGYNLTDGGEMTHFNEEVIQRMKESKRKNPPKVNREKLSASIQYFWDNVSEEYRKQWGQQIKHRAKRPEIKKAQRKFFDSDKNPRLQPVKCVETGICYRSSGEAATAMNGNVTTFHKFWTGYQKTAWGYHWEKITLEDYYEYQSSK